MKAFFLLFLMASLSYSQAVNTPGYKQSIALSAVYPASGNGVTLHWSLDTTGTALTVSRKTRFAATWTVLASLRIHQSHTVIPHWSPARLWNTRW